MFAGCVTVPVRASVCGPLLPNGTVSCALGCWFADAVN